MNTNSFTVSGTTAYPLTVNPNNYTFLGDMGVCNQTIQSKCKCPNPKHTQRCSIEPTGEYCEWCSKGCRKRVMAVHVRYK